MSSHALFATYEDEAFICGITFIDDLEVVTIALGAEVVPNINWPIGYSRSVGESITDDEVTLNETRKLSLGLYTALGYEMPQSL
ncbi:hypothetical protein [Photobacterium frigidiphilum]|uniref:hypothetical protein n=1 Tax=Photobacterium frigidiphilum TaxID=264736 RepID=UPI00187EB790|nr:hypothetical protein [Photobacterium frigidiphilum]